MLHSRDEAQVIMSLESHVVPRARGSKALGPIWAYTVNMTEAHHVFIISSI